MLETSEGRVENHTFYIVVHGNAAIERCLADPSHRVVLQVNRTALGQISVRVIYGRGPEPEPELGYDYDYDYDEWAHVADDTVRTVLKGENITSERLVQALRITDEALEADRENEAIPSATLEAREACLSAALALWGAPHTHGVLEALRGYWRV